jgi:hypothetical protein
MKIDQLLIITFLLLMIIALLGGLYNWFIILGGQTKWIN